MSFKKMITHYITWNSLVVIRKLQVSEAPLSEKMYVTVVVPGTGKLAPGKCDWEDT